MKISTYRNLFVQQYGKNGTVDYGGMKGRAHTLAARADRLSGNGDGGASRFELLRQLSGHYDTNHDGKLGASELRNLPGVVVVAQHA